MIPEKVLKEILSDPLYKICARKDENCYGRITFEHAWEYAGKQINEKWSIMPLCWRHHLGELLDKEFNHWYTLSKANMKDLKKCMPKKNWEQELKALNIKYGTRKEKI